MLDKNPEMVLEDNLENIQNEFKKNVPSLVLCSDSFHKIEFLNKLITSVENPIIFLDMDLLYSGYIESKIIQKKENLIIFVPSLAYLDEKSSNFLFFE